MSLWVCTVCAWFLTFSGSSHTSNFMSHTWRRHCTHTLKHHPTFLLILQFVISLATAALLAAGGVGAEGALTYKWSATGIKGRRHATLLLPALLPLQTGSKGTANCMAQSLSLVEQKEKEKRKKMWLKKLYSFKVRSTLNLINEL